MGIDLRSFIVALLSLLLLVSSFNATTGFTVKGVSIINVLHPGQLLNASQPPSQAKWVVDTVFNGGGQSLVVNFDNTTINYRDSEGRLITSGYPLQISGITNPETAIYTISNNQPEPIYEFSSKVYVGSYNYGYFQSSGTSAPQCPTPYYSSYWTNKTITGSKQITIARVCIYEQQVAAEYPISLAATQFSSVLTLTANGQQETLNLNSNATSGTITSPDGLVQAQWVGSLVTGTQAPTGSQSVAISNVQNNQWDLQNINEYSGTQGYTSHLPTQATFENIIQSCTFVPTQYSKDNNTQELLSFATCLNTTARNDYSTNNQYAAQLLTPGQSIQGYSATQTNYNGGTAFAVSLGSGTFTTNPEIIFTFSGSFVGVVIPVGKPKIVSATSASFTSGSTGKINIQVTNVGNAQGAFYATLSNCPGVSPTQSATNYQVQPSQSQQINISISTSGVNQTISQQCTVTVTDYNGGGSDTSQVNIVSKPANQCTPNSQLVQGTSICPCLNESGVWKVGTGSSCSTCSYGVIANGNGGYKCAPPPTTTATQTTIGQTTIPPTTTIVPWQPTGNKDVLIVTIGSKLTEDSNYKTTLGNYENLVSSRGLSYLYVELDSYDTKLNVNDWQAVKTDINRLEYQTNATYLIILGGPLIVPMPSVTTTASFGAPNDTIIPTDDPYGGLYNNNIPSIVVARVPGRTADEIANILQNSINRVQHSNNNMLIIGDGVNSSHDSFVGFDTNVFSTVTAGLSCASNQNCFYAPPDCLASSCTDSIRVNNEISNNYGIQSYFCHGDGYSCSDYNRYYSVISTSDVPSLNTNPIVMVWACYDGAVASYPSQVYLQYMGNSKTLAITMLDSGAATYIGNTKEGWGPNITQSELAYIYNQFKSRGTIGKAFLAMKQRYLNNPQGPLFEGTAHELQLYGDPTVSISG